MTNRETNQGSGPEPDGTTPIHPLSGYTSRERAPIDLLRGNFDRHVINPLGHTLTIRTLDAIKDDFIQGLFGVSMNPLDSRFQKKLFSPNATERLWGLSEMLTNMGLAYIDQPSVTPVSEILNEAQQSAAERLSVSGPGLHPLDAGLFIETGTIMNTIKNLIHPRHSELHLDDPESLITYLRDPQTYNRFRDIAEGGNAFADSLQGSRNAHPAGVPWRDNPHESIFDETGRTTRELRDAARSSIGINENLDPDDLGTLNQYGLSGPAKQFSSGCPVRHLRFKTDVPDLVDNNLSLTDKQVATLTSLTHPPVIKQFGSSQYYIRRDAYQAVGSLLADGLEIISGKTG